LYFFLCLGRRQKSKLTKGPYQLARHVRAFRGYDRTSRTDDDKISCFELCFDRVVGRANDSLCAVTFNCAAKLFGNGKSQSVDVYLLRMSIFELFRFQVAQNINGDVLTYAALAASESLVIQMMLFNCNVFHKNTHISKTPMRNVIGGFYIFWIFQISRSVFFCL